MINYVVGPNDTLSGIASFYDVSVDEIIKLNNLVDNTIEEGMTLKIPVELKIVYYKVSEGDDLYTIAKKYDMRVETLAKLNGLRVGEYIYPNQQLLVPLQGYKVYITESGDTIFSIQNELKVPVESVIKGNPNLYLLPDQLIIYQSDSK